MRGGWCLPLGPGCIHDVDCDDGNPCTKDRCDEGECVLEPTEGSCELEDDEEGQCRLGRCEPTHDDGCVDDSDCPESHNDCSTVACTDAGECEASTRPDGESCKTVSDAPGTCREGRCRIDEERASERQTDCTVRRNRFGRRYRDCDESLRFLLPEEDLSDARDAIRDQIEEKVHYDMLVGLVELPDGGYNFVTANLRSRDTVRGLVDPSFVAFTIAGYTSGTGWRSRQLQVWIRPYEEGWAVPTAGSRAAVERGRSASRLGLFGVVNVEAYREWLEKNFEKLTPPERYVTDGDTGTDGS